MSYQISIRKKALKILEKVSEPDYTNIKEAIYSLSENPRPHGYKKLKGRDGNRVRAGNYRIIYEIFDKVLVIKVITIGHRKDTFE